MTDSNLGLLATELYLQKERVSFEKMGQLTTEIENYTVKIEKIQKFLAALHEKTKESKRADFSNDPPMQNLIDEVRQICDLPAGTYVWKDAEIEHLTSILNNQISQIESRITQKTTQLTQNQYENNDRVEIMMSMLKDCKDLIKRINDNINRSR